MNEPIATSCEHCGGGIPHNEHVVDLDGVNLHRKCAEETCQRIMPEHVAIDLISQCASRGLAAMDDRNHSKARQSLREIRRLVDRTIS